MKEQEITCKIRNMMVEINSLKGLKDKFEEKIIRDTIQKVLSLTNTKRVGAKLFHFTSLSVRTYIKQEISIPQYLEDRSLYLLSKILNQKMRNQNKHHENTHITETQICRCTSEYTKI